MRKKILFTASILIALLSINLNSYAQCGPGQSELTLSIDFTNDGFPDEDGWRLINLTDGITVDSACFQTYASATGIVTVTICADTGKLYTLKAYDDFGDGLDGSSYSIGYTYGSNIATIGTNNFNIASSLCNPNYSNNELADSSAAFMLQYVAPPACLPPSGLSASTTSATNTTLNWIENGTATQWGVEWDTAGYPAGTARNYAVVNTDTFLTISGLMAQSSYDFAVRAICSSTDSSADVSSSFTTPCVGVSTFPYTENFDGSLTNNVWDCWTVIDADNAGGTWEQNNTYISARSGTWTAHGMGNNNDHLITPQLILPAGTNMRMKVWDIVESSSQPNDYSVLVSTTGKAIADFTDTLASYRATNTTWTERTVDLSAYTGQTIYISLWQSFSNSSFWGFGLDDFLVEATPACLAPSANSGTILTATSANLNWIENGTATQWEVEWDTTGYTLGSGNSVIVNTDTFTTLSGLTAQSAYQWRVRAICGSMDTSAWTSLNSFMTPCAPLAAPISESFDATSVPNCWARYQTTGSGWVFGTPGFSWNNSGCSGSTPADHTGNSGNYAALDFSVPDAGTVLELPTVDVSALTAPYLKFYFTMCGNGYSPLNVLYIETFDGTNWNLADSIRQGTNGWEEFTFVLTPYVYNTNLLKVRFRAESGGSSLVFYGDMAIDDVSIEEAPTCPDPSNLSAFNITANSAQVTWQDNSSATSWLLEWDTTGYPVGNANNSIVVTNDTATISGLMQTTGYEWNVRAICAVGDSSNFLGGSFMTLATCPAPSALSANSLTFDTAELNWTDNSTATSWEIEYGPQGFTLGTGTTVVTTTNPDTISGLMGDTPYSWYVRAICSSSDSSTWTGPNNFRTPCAPFTPTYSEDFSSYIPNCWSEAKGQLTASTSFTSTTSSFWVADGYLNVGTTGSARMNIYSTGRFEWLISPSIDLGTSPNTYRLEFDAGLTDFSGTGTDNMGPDDTLAVVISTDNGATWSINDTVKVYTANNQPSNSGERVFIDLSSYTGLIKVGFYATSTISNTDYNVYIDNFQVRIPPLCVAPSSANETNISASAATLNWVENGTATEWEVEWGASGFAQGTGNVVQVLTDTFVTITGLMSNSSYDWYVRSVCGVSDTSNWTSVSNFSTPCPAFFTAPYFEGFENFPTVSGLNGTYNCWTATRNNTTNDWNIDASGSTPSSGTGPTGPYAGSKYLFFEASGGATNNTSSLISSPILVSGLTVPMIEFYYHMFGDNRGVMGNLYVDVIDGGVTTTVDSLINEQHSAQTDPWLRRQIILGNVGDTIQVVLRATRGTGAQYGDISIDDFAVKEAPTCPDPTANANPIGLTTSSAQISWIENASATQFEVEWDTAGFTLGTGRNVVIVNTDTFLNLSGLTARTGYDWYVRSICGSTDTSDHVGPNSFFTGHCEVVSTSALSYFDDFTTSNGITNISNVGSGYAANGYQDATSQAVSMFATGSINFNTTLVGTTVGVNVWVDWNNDLNFDASEKVFASGGYVSAAAGTITVPAGTALGNYRMRARMDFNSTDPSACGASGSGRNETEDYTFTVVAPPSCLPPTANSLVTNNAITATVSWVENGSATEWEVEWDTVGFTPGTGRNTVQVLTDTFRVITGLTPTTSYDWYVRAVCTVGDSSSWTGGSFTTNFLPAQGVTCATGVPTIIFSEEFDNNSAGWTGNIGSAGGNWEIPNNATSLNTGADVAYSGSSYMNFESSGGTAGSIISPAIDLTNALGQAELSFWLHAYGAAMGDLNVGIGTSATGPFTNVFFTSGQIQTAGSDPWLNAGIDLTSYIGQTIYVEFNMSNYTSYTSDMSIDLFEVTTCAVAPLPYYPIATINTEDATTGVADSSGVTCFTSGTVAGIDLDGNNGYSFTIIDMSSGSQEGINIFNFNDVSNYVVTEGDSIMVRGTVGQFRGLTQFVPDSIMIISTGNTLPAPVVVSDIDETTESKWLSIPTSWVSLSTSGTGSSNVELTNGTDTITMRIDSDTDINDSLVSQGAIIPGDTICGLLGIGGQFNSSTTSPFNDGYQIFPMRWSDLTICRFVPPVVVPYYPIGTINTEDATTGVADSLNVTCFTSGTVVGIDLDGNNGISFTIIDMSSGTQEGMNIFNFNDVSNYVVNEGDSILVRGSIIQFNGLTELSPDSISIISTGSAIPAPIVVTSLDETTESRWLSIPTNYVALNTSGSGSSNVDLTNGTDTITMRIDSDTDINDSLNASNPIAIGDTICGLFGIGGQFDNSNPFTDGYQIFPMRWSDLTICRNTTGIENTDAVASEFKLVPNPTNGLFEIRSSGFNNPTINISIRDISGRLISSEIVNNANGNFTKSFDLNEESAGIYFITIIDGESVINEKLILK